MRTVSLLPFLGAALAAATEIRVPAAEGPTLAIQRAIDACPAADCRILLEGGRYELANGLLIRDKARLVLTAADPSRRPVLVFQDDGHLAGPDPVADSLALKPAGWKRWPVDASSLEGGSMDATNPYSATGILRNGLVLVQGSDDVAFEGLVLDGVKPVAWGSLGVYSGTYPSLFGNAGINLWSSLRFTLRDSEVRNCFAAVAIRNPDTARSRADCGAGRVAGRAACGISQDRKLSGAHRFEGNRIHHCLWAVSSETQGLPSTWVGNRFWELHNEAATLEGWAAGTGGLCYGRATAAATVPAACRNSLAGIQVGGFLYLRHGKAPDSVAQNTFWRIGTLVSNPGTGVSTDKDSLPLLFWNNLVAEPWLDYNADTSGLQGTAVAEVLRGSSNLTPSLGRAQRSNTWAWFPRILLQGVVSARPACLGNRDSCRAVVAAEQARVWPVRRFQMQAALVPGATVDGNYESPSPQVAYLDALQYQGQERGFPFQTWLLEGPSTAVPRKAYSGILPAASGRSVEFRWSALDSDAVAERFGFLRGLPAADTVGRILRFGTDSSLDNHFARSIPMDLDEASATFLMPRWGDAGVDSVVTAGLWSPVGTVPAAITARGAMQPGGGVVGLPRAGSPEAAAAARRHGPGWLLPAGRWRLFDLEGREVGLDQRAEGRRTWAVPRAGFRVGILVGEAGQRLKAVRP